MLESFADKRIKIKRLQLQDGAEIYQAIKHSYREISPWLDWLTPHYSQQNADDFVKFQRHNWNEDIEYSYAIRKTDGTFLGVISLHVFDNNNDVASIGYWIDTRHTGRGYCTDAVKLLVKHCIKILNLIRIEIIIAVNNEASQRVAEKSGACFEAVLKHRIRIKGLPVNARVYAFTEKVTINSME